MRWSDLGPYEHTCLVSFRRRRLPWTAVDASVERASSYESILPREGLESKYKQSHGGSIDIGPCVKVLGNALSCSLGTQNNVEEVTFRRFSSELRGRI